MKSKFVTALAMCATALYPIAASAVVIGTATVQDPVADPADSVTLAAMESQCDALAAARDIDGIGTGDIWSGEVVAGAVTLVSGPTEADGTRDKTNIVGTGTFTPGVTYIQGDPFRIGGSVNMFGDQYATSGSWSDSTYDFTNDFNSTFSHAFTCKISQEVYHPPVHHPATPVQGYYINWDFGHGQGNDNDDGGQIGTEPQGSCLAHNNTGPSLPFWGTDTEQCKFIVTEPAHDAYDDPEYWDAPVLVDTVNGVPVNQDQTDTLSGTESHGGPVQAAGGPFHIGQVVICISPSTTLKKGVPGAWRQQNGYTGDKCTTDWFVNHAVWGSGTESSNGTYISVPDYTFY